MPSHKRGAHGRLREVVPIELVELVVVTFAYREILVKPLEAGILKSRYSPIGGC